MYWLNDSCPMVVAMMPVNMSASVPGRYAARGRPTGVDAVHSATDRGNDSRNDGSHLE